jgi:hypothetical protein
MTCLRTLKICEELLVRVEEVEWGKFYSKFFFAFYSLSQFHETLEQRLLVTELTRLLGPSQEREVPPLLGLEKADLLELMPPSEVRGWGDRCWDQRREMA